jgi:signal transduction histidine kinase/CheY-like chemotaxis protein
MSDLGEDVWFAHSREFAFCCDGDGNVLQADERARRHLNLRAGLSFFTLAAPGVEEKLHTFFRRAAERLVENVELSLISGERVITCSFHGKPDGARVHILGSCLPEEHNATLVHVQESLNSIVGLNREVLRQKREILQQKEQLERTLGELEDSNKGITSLHVELQEKSETLQRTSEVKSRVIANVSHEFRTPVHTILGLSRLLLDGVDGPLSEEQQKQIRFIRTSAEELSVLVDDLLDISKAESGKAILRPEHFDTRDLFGALRGMLKPIVPRKDAVQLIFEEPDEALELETDRGKIAQILRNLVTNALKFTERGSVRVSAAREGAMVAFRVTDTGIGIPPDQLDNIFEEFSQLENPLQRRVKGTGLGLALSRKLAMLLEGTLSAESELDKGSTFTLRVPALHSEAKEFSALSHRPLDPALAPILVVEDDRKTIFIYEKYLAMAGFQVIPARTISEAERLISTFRPAAIVLDVMLDGETSWRFLSQLKSDPDTHDIPVLVVTVTNKEQKARALGADEFWLKPVDKDRLLRKLRSLARSGAPARVLVIDDDERALYLMRKFLDNGPYRLFEARTGPDGVQAAREHRPHVILLDFLLRDMTAFDVLDELKADPRTRNIPVVVVTSQNLEPQDRERLAAETEVILSKQSLSRELAINRIRDALRKAGVGGGPTPFHSES